VRTLALVVLLGFLGLAACGDAVEIEQQLDATSGTRIKLEQYQYEDGTRQLDATAFYDTRLHVRCAAGIWGDGEQRCVPLTDDAVYTDDACTEVVGIVRATPPERDPPVFIGYDIVDGERIPSRLYRAGAVTAAVPAYYERRDGECVGPISASPDAVFVAITAELGATSMQILTDDDVGNGRLALRVRTTTDGLFVPLGLRDRTLDVACNPVARGGIAVCEPPNVLRASMFADENCTEPAFVIDATEPLPPLMRTTDAGGCTTYHSVGMELAQFVWNRTSTGGCERVQVSFGLRAYRLDPAIELPTLSRTFEDIPALRRLQHVTLQDTTDPELRFTADQLVDRAIRDECRRELAGDELRCMPANTTFSTIVYSGASCAAIVRVAEVPERTCTPQAFATAPALDGNGVTLHAIGDPMHAPMYRLTSAGCQPFAAAPGVVVRELGPTVPVETFLTARRYGER
jgi:hypothetical protein